MSTNPTNVSAPSSGVSRNSNKILLTVRIHDEAIDYIRRELPTYDIDIAESALSNEELKSRSEGAAGILCILSNLIDAGVLDRAPNLRAVSTMSVGYDHIDLKECKKRGIQVGNTPGVLAESTAELTLSLMLFLARRIGEGVDHVRAGTWPASWLPMWMCGKDISNSVVGIIGMGETGLALATRLVAFPGCKVLYNSRSEKPAANKLGATFATIEELVSQSDFVSVNCALNDQTRRMFSRKLFSMMKPDALFINTARGDIVDQAALYDILFNKKIGGAALDVTTPEPLPKDHPLLSLTNCYITPHIGSASIRTRAKMAQIAARNLVDGIKGTPLLNAL